MVCKRVNSRTDDESAYNSRIILSKRISKLIDSVQYAETDEDVKRIMANVNALRKQMPKERKKTEVSREACDAFIESFCDLESHDADVQRMILKKTIDKIVVKPDELVLFTMMQKGVCIIVTKEGYRIEKALPEGRA